MRPTDDDRDIDRTRDLPAEREVIGCVLRMPGHVEEAMRLRADDFSREMHQIIWRAIAHLLDRGDPIGPQSVAATCGNALDGDARRDLQQMAVMASGAPGVLSDAIAKVQDASRRRATAAAFGQARRRAITSEDPIETIAAQASVEVEEALSGDDSSFLDGVEANKRLRVRLQTPLRVVPTGIRKLDHVLEGGLMPGRMLALVAQTKVGKTTLASTISYNVLEIEEPHLVISLERDQLDIEQACAARALRINALDLQRDFVRHEAAYDRYAADPKHALRTYMHRPGATLEDIQRMILRAHRRGARGFILDYWQLIQRPPRENSNDHLSRCAQTLANMANRLGMWSIVNAQSHADGMPRECQALWLASPTLYVIRRDAPDKPEAWLQCMGSSYTKGLNAGGPSDAAMILDSDEGPYFRSV